MLPWRSAVMPSGLAALGGSTAKVSTRPRSQAAAGRVNSNIKVVTRSARSSMTTSLAVGGGGSAQRARCAHGGDAGRIILQEAAQDRLGVLAEAGGGGGAGDGAGGLDRRGHLADAAEARMVDLHD